MKYPSKPWFHGQRFIEDGVIYEYNANNNSWNFSPLTYNRLAASIRFEIPHQEVSFKLEISREMDFSNLFRVIDTTNISSWKYCYLFNGNTYVPLQQSVFTRPDFISLFVIPEIDQNERYFCRWKWSNMNEWRGIIYPTVGNGFLEYDDVWIDNRLDCVEHYLEDSDEALKTLGEDLIGGVNLTCEEESI